MRGEKTNDKTDPPNVAIVEDEADLRSILELILQKHGIHVSFRATDGDEAIELFKKANPRPDIILMDHRMMRMDGIEATKNILSIDPYTKIIFLSADAHVKDEALKAGAKLFIAKPASLNAILKAIEDVHKQNEPYGNNRYMGKVTFSPHESVI